MRNLKFFFQILTSDDQLHKLATSSGACSEVSPTQTSMSFFPLCSSAQGKWMDPDYRMLLLLPQTWSFHLRERAAHRSGVVFIPKFGSFIMASCKVNYKLISL